MAFDGTGLLRRWEQFPGLKDLFLAAMDCPEEIAVTNITRHHPPLVSDWSPEPPAEEEFEVVVKVRIRKPN